MDGDTIPTSPVYVIDMLAGSFREIHDNTQNSAQDPLAANYTCRLIGHKRMRLDIWFQYGQHPTIEV